MAYKLVQEINGDVVVSTFDGCVLIPSLEERGFELAGINRNHHNRPELQGAPAFDGLCDPMWDGEFVRYLTPGISQRLAA